MAGHADVGLPTIIFHYRSLLGWREAVSAAGSRLCRVTSVVEGDDPSLGIQADHQRQALRDAEFLW
jgi:hypothetical protein